MKKLAFLLLCACGGEAASPRVPVVTVAKQKFARAVQADGHLRAVKATPVTVPSDVNGPLRVKWLAPDGAVVKKGDPVARFDDMELRTRLADAEADKEVAEAKRRKEALLLATAERDRRRTTDGATRELTLTRTFQRRDNAIFSRDQIIEGEIDEGLQTAKVEHAERSQTVDKQVARSKLGLIAVEAKKAEDAIKRSKEGLGSLEVRAPHDGVLMLKRTWRGETVRVGDTVWRSETVAEIPLVEKMEAEVFVLEAEAAGLGKGKRATVTIEAHPERPVSAEVTRVETVAKRRQMKSPTQYFGVVLGLSKTDPAIMKPGQRVQARLHLHEEEALVLPRPALFDKAGKWVVYRREGADGERFLPVEVKLGASTAGRVVIASGLRAGDVVALRDPAQSVDEILSAPAATPGKGR